MSVSYKCPVCEAKLKSPKALPPGKEITCPACGEKFKPEGEAAPGVEKGTFKFADEDEPKKPAAPKKPGAKAEAPKKEEPVPTPEFKKPFADDDEESAESIKKGYGVVQETEEEKKEAEKNKPKFKDVQEKFKKSARGPAQGLLVMPSNLLIGEGLLTAVGGIVLFVVGMWPLVFNDAPPGEEELDEAIISMLLGVCIFAWGALVCFGASQMQELGSYPIAMAGAIMGIVPLLVGIFGIIMLLNPKVKAGFEEGTGGPDDEDEEDEEEDEDDDEDEEEDEDEDEEEEDDDEESGATKAAKKVAKKSGKKMLKGLLGGGDDE